MREFTGNLPGEIWKIVPCTNDRYAVSSLGRIKSLWRVKGTGITYKAYLLDPTYNDQGYAKITLQFAISPDTEKAREVSVHRLVATTFIPNPECKKTVNHKDGNKANNCVDNLEWMTQSENNKHAYLTGLNSNHIEYNTQKMPVECIETGQIWPSISAASRDITGCTWKLFYPIRHNMSYEGKHYKNISIEEYNVRKEDDRC